MWEMVRALNLHEHDLSLCSVSATRPVKSPWTSSPVGFPLSQESCLELCSPCRAPLVTTASLFDLSLSRRRTFRIHLLITFVHWQYHACMWHILIILTRTLSCLLHPFIKFFCSGSCCCAQGLLWDDGSRLSPGAWWAHLWLHNWRQWRSPPSLVVNSSAWKG